MEIRKQELDQAFNKAAPYNGIEQTPGGAAVRQALTTGIAGAVVTALATTLTNAGDTTLAVAVAAVVFNTLRTYEWQAAIQSAYKDLTTQPRKEMPNPNL